MTGALLVLTCLSVSRLVVGKRMGVSGETSLAGIEAHRSNDTDETLAELPGLPLWPELVPPAGQTWMFMSREAVRWVETNEYQWWKANMPFANAQGKWMSNTFGHQTVHVRDMSGQERFMIRNSKHVWNPFSMRSSFRVHPAGNKEAVLYTLNKDVIGRGLLGMKEEWRIYYGRERQGQQVYYCVGSYMGWSYNCYKTQAAYDAGAPPIAYTEQEMNAGAILTDFSQWLPDNYRLFIREGVDSALILALMTVIDICNDAKHQQESQQGSLLESGVNSTDSSISESKLAVEAHKQNTSTQSIKCCENAMCGEPCHTVTGSVCSLSEYGPCA